MRVDIGEVAETQLEKIWKDHEAYSPHSARKLMERFYKRLKQLGQFPLSGEQIPELGYPQLRHIFVGPYRVLYQVHPDSLEVIGFLHSSQEWPLE